MRRPRLLLALAVTATVVVASFSVPAGQAPAEAAIGALTWSDEFNRPAGSGVDTSKWNFDIGGSGWGNNERQYYTNSTSNAVHDGNNLVITARRDNPANYNCHYGRCEFTSARLLTNGKFTQRYGRFESRMKLPRGQGIWPAFWMLGDNMGSVGWPQSGEIDIMEFVGKEPNTVYGTIHGPGYSGAGGITGSRNLGRPVSDDFHTFTVDWSPNLIVWYIDGSEYHRVTNSTLGGRQWVFDHNFFMILNLAVGGDWPGLPDASTQFPQSLVVDYVRVWAYTEGTTPPPAGSTNRIRSNGGRCLDINGGVSQDGLPLQIFDCNDSAAQKWTFGTDGTIRGLGKCMDAAGGSTANNTVVQLANCNGGQAQQFRLNAAGDLVNVPADKCVDIVNANNANFAKLVLWPCHGGWNQKWYKN
jgi:beta-glucanase (GH16 family)